MKIEDGILMFGRLSIGWNFHPARTLRAFGLGVAFADDRVLVLIGPFMVIWLL